MAGGGYSLGARHVAGLAVWLVVVALLALGSASRASLGRPFYWAVGLIAGLALFSALSSLWSGSIELSVVEADRVLIYLGVFLAAFLLAQTAQSRERFAEGLAIALAVVAVLGLASRLLPDLVSVEQSLGSGPRLRYPLGYWNANGVAIGIGIALAAWLSQGSRWAALRWGAVGALPAMLLTLYVTYSRGGVLAMLIACGCLLALSHNRLRLLATLAIGILAALPAVLALQARGSVADNLADGAAAGQGATVLLVLACGVALALALFAGLRRLERQRRDWANRALRISRDPLVLRWVAIVAAVLALGAIVFAGGKAWDRFSSPDIQFPSDPSKHFGDLSSAGRHDFWRVAIDAFEEEPLIGHGSGTYQFSWAQLRSIELSVHDAHSLYLEAFAELGLVGGLLTLAAVALLLWQGLMAWRAANGPRREAYAAIFSACLAFAIAAGIDWLWEIAAMGTIFFGAAGVLVAARCDQLAAGDVAEGGPAAARAAGRAGPAGVTPQRRFGLAVGGLALAWIAALALVGPLLVDREIKASQAAAARGDLGKAGEKAETARTIEPWAASPYVQLGLVAEAEGDYATAAGRISQAIHREDRNWLLYFLRSRIEYEGGDPSASAADLREARRLNPLENCLQEGWNGCK